MSQDFCLKFLKILRNSRDKPRCGTQCFVERWHVNMKTSNLWSDEIKIFWSFRLWIQIPENSENLALETLVFMWTWQKPHRNFLVDYYLTDKLDDKNMPFLSCWSWPKNLVSNMWWCCSNINTLESLGCNFTKDYHIMVAKFEHPTRLLCLCNTRCMSHVETCSQCSGTQWDI